MLIRKTIKQTRERGKAGEIGYETRWYVLGLCVFSKYVSGRAAVENVNLIG